MWVRLIHIVADLWLIAPPTVLGHTGVWRTNDILIGVLIVCVALAAIWYRSMSTASSRNHT